MTEVVFENVTKTYGAVRAVDGLSIRLEDGSFTTILGPSGSGKTTMLSLISGIASLSAGRIILGGRDITNVRAADRRIGLVFQSYALFPHMTVFDNVAYPLKLRRMAKSEIKRRVDEALALVRLEAYAGRKPKALSGGQQQRVAIARAVVFEPALLLLDEPLSALDRNLREEVRVELREIQRKLGITTIMDTHDQEEAMSLSDRVVLLREGRVEQVGTPAELYHQPMSRFTAEFLGTAGFLEGHWRDGAIETDGGCRFPAPAPPTRPDGKVTALLRADAVRLVPEAEGHPAVVTDVEFLGEIVRYSVELVNGPRLFANGPGTETAHAIGDRIGAAWDPARLHYLDMPVESRPREERPEAGRAHNEPISLPLTTERTAK